MPPKPRRRKPTQGFGQPNRPATTSQAEAPPPAPAAAPQAEAPPPTSQAEADLDQRCMDEGGPAEAIMAWYSAHEPEKADVGHVAKVIRMFKKRAQKLKVGGDVAPDWRKMMYAAFYENNQVNPCHLIKPVEPPAPDAAPVGGKPGKISDGKGGWKWGDPEISYFRSAALKPDTPIVPTDPYYRTQGGGFRRKKIKSKKTKKGKSKKMKKRKSRRMKKKKSKKRTKKRTKKNRRRTKKEDNHI